MNSDKLKPSSRINTSTQFLRKQRSKLAVVPEAPKTPTLPPNMEDKYRQSIERAIQLNKPKMKKLNIAHVNEIVEIDIEHQIDMPNEQQVEILDEEY